MNPHAWIYVATARTYTKRDVENLAVAVRDEIHAAGRYVSAADVIALVRQRLNVARFDDLRVGRPHEIPALKELTELENKVFCFIQVFMNHHSIVTLFELDEELCAAEAVKTYSALRLGPLLKHPLVVKGFAPPPSLTAPPAITSADVGIALRAYQRQQRTGTDHRPVEVHEFVRWLAVQRRVADPLELCIKIHAHGVGLYLKTFGAVECAQRSKEAEFHTKLTQQIKTELALEQEKATEAAHLNRDARRRQLEEAVRRQIAEAQAQPVEEVEVMSFVRRWMTECNDTLTSRAAVAQRMQDELVKSLTRVKAQQECFVYNKALAVLCKLIVSYLRGYRACLSARQLSAEKLFEEAMRKAPQAPPEAAPQAPRTAGGNAQLTTSVPVMSTAPDHDQAQAQPAEEADVLTFMRMWTSVCNDPTATLDSVARQMQETVIDSVRLPKKWATNLSQAGSVLILCKAAVSYLRGQRSLLSTDQNSLAERLQATTENPPVPVPVTSTSAAGRDELEQADVLAFVRMWTPFCVDASIPRASIAQQMRASLVTVLMLPKNRVAALAENGLILVLCKIGVSYLRGRRTILSMRHGQVPQDANEHPDKASAAGETAKNEASTSLAVAACGSQPPTPISALAAVALEPAAAGPSSDEVLEEVERRAGGEPSALGLAALASLEQAVCAHFHARSWECLGLGFSFLAFLATHTERRGSAAGDALGPAEGERIVSAGPAAGLAGGCREERRGEEKQGPSPSAASAPKRPPPPEALGSCRHLQPADVDEGQENAATAAAQAEPFKAGGGSMARTHPPQASADADAGGGFTCDSSAQRGEGPGELETLGARLPGGDGLGSGGPGRHGAGEAGGDRDGGAPHRQAWRRTADRKDSAPCPLERLALQDPGSVAVVSAEDIVERLRDAVPSSIRIPREGRRAMAIGRWGEELVWRFLRASLPAGTHVEWVNGAGETGAPFDVRVREAGGRETLVEVKSTAALAMGKELCHITPAQLCLAEKARARFWIVRVYGAGSVERVRLVQVEDPVRLWRQGAIRLGLFRDP
eukprot:tig00001027_g6398.t1